MKKLILLGVALHLALSAQVARAVPPCSDVLGMTVIPLTNGLATYCVSDYGWSDTWFVGGAPAIYDPRLDVLSGDDGPNLHFGILGGEPSPFPSGTGWLSPIMDVGTLTPSWPTASPWTVTTAVHFVATGTESLIHHPLGLDMLITTNLDPFGQEVTQRFTITNVSAGTTFTDLRFADYFNYHPNGSTFENSRKGTVTYDPLSGITIAGPDDGTLIANGSMRGERVDDAHGRNGPFLATPIAVWDMVQTNVYLDPGAAIAIGPGDVAGALAWDLGDLAPSETTTFTIFKLAMPLSSVPEPPTMLLILAVGLAWLMYNSKGGGTPLAAGHMHGEMSLIARQAPGQDHQTDKRIRVSDESTSYGAQWRPGRAQSRWPDTHIRV